MHTYITTTVNGINILLYNGWLNLIKSLETMSVNNFDFVQCILIHYVIEDL